MDYLYNHTEPSNLQCSTRYFYQASFAWLRLILYAITTGSWGSDTMPPAAVKTIRDL